MNIERDGGPGMKYALLLLGRVHEGLNEVFFDRDARVLTASLESLVVLDEVGHWKEWLGTIAWDGMASEQSMVLATVPTARRKVLDHDNEAAIGRLKHIWYALQLARPAMQHFGELRFLSGATEQNHTSRLHDLRSTGRMPALTRPMYMSTKEYVERTWRTDDDWVDRWLTMDRLLGEGRGLEGLPRILDLALVGYSQACQSHLLEFRIPKFIRAAEGVLGLPSGEGMKKRFAKRVRAVVAALDHHPFLGWRGDKVGKHLKDLFQLRSDCVHGKIPFEEMGDAGEEGKLKAARYEYASELVARDLLVWALSHPRRAEVFATRKALEDAWTGDSPPKS